MLNMSKLVFTTVTRLKGRHFLASEVDPFFLLLDFFLFFPFFHSLQPCFSQPDFGL